MANLVGCDTRWTGEGEFDQLSAAELDTTTKALLARGVEELADAQELFWASDSYALLMVFQAVDASCGSSMPPTSPSGLVGTNTSKRTRMPSSHRDTVGVVDVMPADHKHVMQATTAAIIVDTIQSLDLQWPTVSDKERVANVAARRELEAESDQPLATGNSGTTDTTLEE